jgi:flagellar export protein FliJ
MKSRDGVLRLKRFQVEEKRRQVAQIDATVAEFERIAKELDDQVRAEQERSGIHDVNHFAYPTFAKAALQRRDNLVRSSKELAGQRAAAQVELDAALGDLQKLEALVERDMANEKLMSDKQAQLQADHLGPVCPLPHSSAFAFPK